MVQAKYTNTDSVLSSVCGTGKARQHTNIDPVLSSVSGTGKARQHRDTDPVPAVCLVQTKAPQHRDTDLVLNSLCGTSKGGSGSGATFTYLDAAHGTQLDPHGDEAPRDGAADEGTLVHAVCHAAHQQRGKETRTGTCTQASGIQRHWL